jgi:hypothetical protein
VVVITSTEPVLMDREALAQWTTRSVEVIRKRCTPVEYGSDGRAMYDARQCADLLLKVRRCRRVRR